jgi:hypothetical protein
MSSKKLVLKQIDDEKFELDRKIRTLGDVLDRKPVTISENQFKLLTVQFSAMQTNSQALKMRYEYLLDALAINAEARR